MGNYKAYFSGKSIDIVADSLYGAKLKAITEMKVPKSKQGLLAVVFVGYVDGEEIAVDTASL